MSCRQRQQHLTVCIASAPEEGSCFVDVLLSPLPGNEALQQVSDAIEDKSCVFYIFVKAVAKLCILKHNYLGWAKPNGDGQVLSDSKLTYRDHLPAFWILHIVRRLVTISKDADRDE
jgi:hypothetical protein